MKLSINWIFDHIDQVSLENINIHDLLNKFSLTSVEVDDLQRIDIDLNQFTLAKVKCIDNSKNHIILYSDELNKELKINLELDKKLDIEIDNTYLLKKNKDSYTQATLQDLGANNLSNNKLLPAIHVPEEDLSGNWKQNFENTDYIIDISNTAVTNRPDLWGHRGFAREFAAILDKKLIPENHILTQKDILSSDKNYIDNTFSIEIKEEENRPVDYSLPCRRFAGLYFKSIENKPSLLKIATRLLRVDSKPFNAIVDFTNYVMLDLSQPMHAFDVDTINSKKIIARFAFNKESLELLDKSKVTLTSNDYVITDSEKPIALAGIKGGYQTAISNSTNTIFLESANFDPFVIRNTSLNTKLRTESSSRFEKNLDPNQNIDAILRFLKLLDINNIDYQADKYILSLGQPFGKKTISIVYEFILNKLGVSKFDLPPDKIIDILSKLEFEVKLQEEDKKLNFIVKVPTYRSIKDITIKEDLLKEIARFIGYDYIKAELPTKKTVDFDISNIMQNRAIKYHTAYATGMNEVQTYAFFDQEFLNHIDYQPEDYLEIQNPQSQNYKVLVTTLIPNLLKCIYINLDKSESLRFFELNRIWFKQYGNTNNNPNDFISVEFLELSGIFYDNKSDDNFYDYKAKLDSLFNMLGIQNEIKWVKFRDVDLKFCDKFYDCLQTAELFYKNRSIGTFGRINQNMLNKIALGQAYAFELDANFLINIKQESPTFQTISKYPESHFDISLLINQEIEVATIINKIKDTSSKIKHVDLLDIFTKKEWLKDRSLTFRVRIQDKDKTLIRQEIDELYLKIISNLKNLGASIR